MLTIAIQAGGESRRMGQDKALLPFLGEPLIARVLKRVAHIADELLVTTNRLEEYGFLRVRLVADITPGRGALGGLYTALMAANQPYVAVIACDMPFINPTLLAAERDLLISEQADVVIPETEDGLEPFHAVYRRSTCLPHVKAALEANQWRVDSWFRHVRVYRMQREQILQFDPHLLSFLNINTPEELESAIRLTSL